MDAASPASPQDLGDAAPRVTRQLAEFIAASRWEDLTEPLRREGKRSLLNSCAIVLGSCRNVLMERLSASAIAFAGPPQATMLGRNRRVDVLTAAFVNGAGGNAFDYDDTHIPTILHPAAPVTGAALALAEHRRMSGRDLLHAFLLGIEAECRIANAVSPEHYARGFHITSTCGHFGAAAAAGKLLKLGADRLVWSLGNAATQAAGLVESVGFMSKSISVGNAARNGLAAAFFAQDGVESPETPIEGPFGFARVMGRSDPDFSAITNGLGQDWEAQKNTYKAYPCGIVLHAVIDACLDLRERHTLTPDRIAEVTVVGHRLLGQRTDRPRVNGEREAVVSAQHTVAVALIDGAVGLAQYSDERIADAQVAALRAKVRVEADLAMRVGPARVVVRTTDGETFEATVEDWLGGPEVPLSDEQLERKFLDLVAVGAPQCDGRRFIDMIWGLEGIDDIGVLIEETGLA